MTADVFTLSRNPHYLCTWAPCTVCIAQRKAEQEARDRHPAGTDLPTPLTYRVDWADYEVVIDTPDATLRLDESMLAELTARLTNPEPCDRDACQEPAEDGGLCVAHRDAADALPVGGWRK